MTLVDLAIGYGGVFLLVLGVVSAVLIVLSDPESLVRVKWVEYTARLDELFGFLRYDWTGVNVAKIQIGSVVLLLALAFWFKSLVCFAVAVVIVIIPKLLFEDQRVKRIYTIEQQLDKWMMLLANALRANPSIGESLASTARITQAPLKDEIELVLKELHLGTPLDQALLSVGKRIDSSVVSSAFASILVARQTGGDLSGTLEESSKSLREMARLEGVVRSKTAESKSQGYVLGATPFGLVLILYAMDPNWFDPMTASFFGYVMLTVASGFWVGAILLAKKILSVDL